MIEREETRPRNVASRIVGSALGWLEKIMPTVGNHTVVEPSGEFLDADERGESVHGMVLTMS
jgi:hypothetical protein